MRLLTGLPVGSADRWHRSEDAFPPVSFCVRALILDGLAVPPFDRHSGADGRLREAGLDARAWGAWVRSVVRQREVLGAHARALGAPDARGPSPEQARAAAEVLREPGSFCPGSAELRARLNALFADFAAAGEAWRWRMSDARRLHGSGRQQRALWKALVPLHDRLPTLSVLLVEYPEPVVMPLPPAACLIAPGDDPEGLGRQVVAAAKALAAAE